MRRRRIHFLSCGLIIALGICGAMGCGSGDDPPTISISAESSDATNAAPSSPAAAQTVTAGQPSGDSRFTSIPDGPISAPPVKREFEVKPVSPEVLIKTNQGDIRVRLDYEKAPQTVGSFLGNYVDKQFYNNTVFHYVDKGFIAIAGGFTADYKPKETKGYVICESDNGLKNRRGTVAMTRLPDYVDSGTSQFFFNLADNTALDFQGKSSPSDWGYCVFGEVVDGMDVLDRIAGSPVTDRPEFPKSPAEPIIIQTIERIE